MMALVVSMAAVVLVMVVEYLFDVQRRVWVAETAD